MMLKRFPLVKATFTAILAISLVGCGRSDNALSSNNADEDALSMAAGDTGTNGEVMHGGMFGGGLGSLIDLTSDQKQQIKSIYQNYRLHRRDKENQISPDQWKANRIAMRDSLKNVILAVLTPEQKAFLDQIKAQLKAGTVPDTLIKKRVEHLTSILSLTSDQQVQAFNILKQEMQARLEIMKKDNGSFLDSLQAHNIDRHKRDFRADRQIGLSQEFMNILNDQQKTIIQQKINERRENFKRSLFKGRKNSKDASQF
jgi:Spy/CpxP family protein refolding chaperone